MSKKVMFTVCALWSVLAVNAYAGIWDSNELGDAGRAKLQKDCGSAALKNCQVVKEAPRSKLNPAEKEDAIWKEITVYQLIKATPTQVAAAFADYANYKTMFAAADLKNAVVASGQIPNVTVDLTYRVRLGGVFDKETDYTLNNVWSQDVGGYHVAWMLDHSEQIYWVEGRHDIEPVSIDGKLYTVVKYYNYANPKEFRLILDTDTAREQNTAKLARLVDVLRNWVEKDPKKLLEGQVNSFCSKWQCQR